MEIINTVSNITLAVVVIGFVLLISYGVFMGIKSIWCDIKEYRAIKQMAKKREDQLNMVKREIKVLRKEMHDELKAFVSKFEDDGKWVQTDSFPFINFYRIPLINELYFFLRELIVIDLNTSFNCNTVSGDYNINSRMHRLLSDMREACLLAAIKDVISTIEDWVQEIGNANFGTSSDTIDRLLLLLDIGSNDQGDNISFIDLYFDEILSIKLIDDKVLQIEKADDEILDCKLESILGISTTLHRPLGIGDGEFIIPYVGVKGAMHAVINEKDGMLNLDSVNLSFTRVNGKRVINKPKLKLVGDTNKWSS